jgi:predicted transcriptional regulator
MKDAKSHLAYFAASFAYRASMEELQGIDRGLRDSAEGKFASAGDVKAIFSKYLSSADSKQN